MSRFSTRFARHIALLLVLVLPPVIVHSYVEVLIEDCAGVEALIPDQVHDPERKARIDLGFRPERWIEGELEPVEGEPAMRYAVIRTYDPKRVYYRPEYRMMPGDRPIKSELTWAEAGGETLPIHRSHYRGRTQHAPRKVVSYLLVYEGKPVANGYTAQLWAAPLHLLRGRAPMTLFFAWSEVTRKDLAAAAKRQQAWLVESLEHYREICIP